ncbi:MAG: flavin monoamine oxidase family protein [Pseudanabaenaceae cyanobacterium]
MARSSLWWFLRKAYRQAVFSISRRHLLRAGLFAAGLATAGALHSCTNEPPKNPEVKETTDDPILIVGAGLAGLTIGYRLWQKQIPFTLIEGSDRVGGRMFSQSNALGTAQTTELGGEFINTGHKNIQTLAQEMGLELVDLDQIDRGLNQEIWFFDNRKIEFKEVAQAFVPLAKQILKDQEAIGDFSYQKSSPKAQALDRLSVADYIQKYARNSFLAELLNVAYTIEYGRDTREQSAFNLIFLLGTGQQELQLFGESDERYTIKGGNQQLPQKLAEKISNFIETGTYLESIRQASDGRYQVSVRKGNSSQQITYRRVVLAIPFTILRAIDLQVELPPRKQKAIKELGYGYNAKLITSYSDRIWRTRYKSNGTVFTDLGWQNTWETGKYAPTQTGLITNYLGGSKCLALSTNAVQEGKNFVNSFRQIFPEVDKVYQQALLINWPKLPLTQGSYSCYLVGQATQFFGIEGEPVANLFFAGEHCSTEHQGYMEGACDSAQRVVELLTS